MQPARRSRSTLRFNLREPVARRPEFDNKVRTDGLCFCFRLSLFQRFKLIQEASGARTELSGRVKPAFGPKNFPRPSARVQLPNSRLTSPSIPPLSEWVGDITISSPFESRSMRKGSFSAQNRSISSLNIGCAKRIRNGDCSSCEGQIHGQSLLDCPRGLPQTLA
jgi:hypothetical protein